LSFKHHITASYLTEIAFNLIKYCLPQGTTDYIYCKDGHCQFVTQNYADRLQAGPSSELAKENSGKSECEKNFISAEEVAELEQWQKASKEGKLKNLPIHPDPEVATVALTEGEEDLFDKIFHGRVNPTQKQSFQDDELPEILVKPKGSGLKALLDLSDETCNKIKFNWKAFTSTWLSVSAKGVKFSDHLPNPSTAGPIEPHCAVTPVSIRSMDHLVGVRRRGELKYSPEAGLAEAFQNLAGQVDEGVVDKVALMATRIGVNLLHKPNSWILSTAASLYWRVKGNALEALECVRHSLYHAPNSMRDVPLLSLANIMHRAGLYHDAIIATNLALQLSPDLVINHFTMANIYMGMGNLEKAKQFYMSTLSLQSTFEPAVERLMAIMCGRK